MKSTHEQTGLFKNMSSQDLRQRKDHFSRQQAEQIAFLKTAVRKSIRRQHSSSQKQAVSGKSCQRRKVSQVAMALTATVNREPKSIR